MKFQSPLLALGILISFAACQTTPPYARDTKARLAKELRIESKNRASSKTPADILNQGPHTLALINLSSNWTCFAISLDNSHWWNVTPAVGRTCTLPISLVDHCFLERKYLPLGKVNCSQPIHVWLKFRNAQGDIGTLVDPYRLVPNCQDQGTAIQFGD
jgi:hypothetical protein